MSAADDDGMPAGKKFLLENFGKRAVREFAVQHLFDLDIAAGNGVANHDQVGRGREVAGIKGAGELKAEGFKERRSRKINTSVRTRDVVAVLREHAGERSHRRAADANHVDVLHLRFWGLLFRDKSARMPKGSTRPLQSHANATKVSRPKRHIEGPALRLAPPIRAKTARAAPYT